MIKFFRHIRKNIIMKNQTGKYFKYAIGEIVLVVIGILIALQINNWNEGQKKDTLKKEYKTALINDYVKDTIELGDRIRLNEKTLIYIDSIIKIFNHIEPNKNNVLELAKQHNFLVGARATNAYNTNSFNLLISSGSIDLFDKNLRKELMELNRLQDYEKQVSESNKTLYFNHVQNIIDKYPVYKNFDGFNENIRQAAWNTIHSKTIMVDVINFYSFRRYLSSRYIQLTSAIQEQTKNVITLLINENR